jgi:hypothetical protein
MARADISRLFEAKPNAIEEMFQMTGGVAGFKIPEYQRKYDWSINNISRFFEDTISGMRNLEDEIDSVTFLGTTIFIEDKSSKEATFDGRSFDVIDGQQRLTTFSIIATVLYDEIQKLKNELSSTPDPDLFSWLEKESIDKQGRLLNCIRGKTPNVGDTDHPFPSICRDGDNRANNEKDSKYKSVIGDYLYRFTKHARDASGKPFDSSYLKALQDPEAQSFISNIRSIKKFVGYVHQEEIKGNALSLEPHKPSEVYCEPNFVQLFSKLPLPSQMAKRNKVLDGIKTLKAGNQLSLIRLLVFTSYYLDFIIITSVTPENSSYAFDIFDALNTTGEPLTAIQTFKPFVVKNEARNGDYSQSDSKKYFDKVESYLEEFGGSPERQKQAKELVTSFALYVTGERVSQQLSVQRRYLSTKFRKCTQDKKMNESSVRFVKLLSEVSGFKRRFWNRESIRSQFLKDDPDGKLRLCFHLLREMKMTLTIPIMSRFYNIHKDDSNLDTLKETIYAFVAFIALRRAATGSTAGIDNDFRQIMLKGVDGNPALNHGLVLAKQPKLISLDEFKKSLRSLLKRKIGEVTKDNWVAKVVNKPLYDDSVPLSKFLLMSAAHSSYLSSSKKTLHEKGNLGTANDYLNEKRWLSQECETVEHIAPINGRSTGYSNEIYLEENLLHGLGNLTLLPQDKNSAVGNQAWKIKSLYFKAFGANSPKAVKKLFDEAKAKKIEIGNATKKLLNNQVQLPLADSISHVPNWTPQVIRLRAENLASLAWDEISKWLDYK